MPRTLSSAWTVAYRYLLPIAWLAAAIVLNPVWRGTPASTVNPVTGQASPSLARLIIPFVLAALAIAIWTTMRYKRVRLDDDGTLVVGGWFHEWRVPASLITDVRQRRWLRSRPITVRLRSDVGFGTRFTFAPPQRWLAHWMFWREDPEVEELRTLAANSQAGWRSGVVGGDQGRPAVDSPPDAT